MAEGGSPWAPSACTSYAFRCSRIQQAYASLPMGCVFGSRPCAFGELLFSPLPCTQFHCAFRDFAISAMHSQVQLRFADLALPFALSAALSIQNVIHFIMLHGLYAQSCKSNIFEIHYHRRHNAAEGVCFLGVGTLITSDTCHA